MLVNAAITIFNKFPDRATKKFVYVPHYVEHVWFHTNQKSTVSDKGLHSADEYNVRIPYAECADWIPPNDYTELSEPEGKWTVQNGDFFILGEWAGEKVDGIADIKKDFFGVAGMVLSHSENFFGSSQHIRIGGGS